MKLALPSLLILCLARSSFAATATSAPAPPEATYITQTTNAALANAQALSGLATGPLFVTTSTGVLSTATSLPITGGTVVASTPLLNTTQTWNNGAVTFTGLKQVITNTASGGSSLLADFQVGSTSVFNVATNGTIVSRSALNLQSGSALTVQLSGASGLFMASDFTIGWNSVLSGGGSLFANGAMDTVLGRAGAAVLSVEGASSVGGAMRFTAKTATQITSNQNDYNPGGRSKFQRWSTDASRNVTGLVFASAGLDGEEHVIVNVGAQNIVLVNESASSTAANRFTNSTGADITLSANQAADVIYDGTTSRWRAFKRN